MKLLCTIAFITILATGCASALKNNTPTATQVDPAWQTNIQPTVYEYIVLADGTVLASPNLADVKLGQFSSPVISSVHINADYR